MTEPWFDPNVWSWLPGTAFGGMGGVWGALAGTLAPRGRARGLVLGMGVGLIAASLASLVAAVVAIGTGQPYGIWFGFLLPGLQGPLLLGFLLPLVARRYREAEARRIEAQDIG